MLTLDKTINPDFPRGYIITAIHRTAGHVQFPLASTLLTGSVLGCDSGVVDSIVQKLYDDNRSKFEAACSKAFAERPSNRIDLQESDFR